MNSYAPRYSAYCAAHGFDHAGMLEHDRKRSPGGVNAPLMLWISERWREWDARRPEAFAGDGEHRSELEREARAFSSG